MVNSRTKYYVLAINVHRVCVCVCVCVITFQFQAPVKATASGTETSPGTILFSSRLPALPK